MIDSLILEDTEEMKIPTSFWSEDNQEFRTDEGSEAQVTPEISKFIEELGPRKSLPPPSVVKAPEIEKKMLPDHLKYVYLEKEEKLLVIVTSELEGQKLE